MLHFDQVSFRYEPFPIGVAKGVFSDADYDALSKSYPSLDRFKLVSPLGNQYTMYTKDLRAFASSNPVWKEFMAWVESDAFLKAIFEMLLEHHIDMGYGDKNGSLKNQLNYYLRCLKRGVVRGFRNRLYVDTNLVMMPADGGYLYPHTDRPGKVINMATTMIEKGIWEDSFGGGTDINAPRDRTRWYNYKNERYEFDEVDVLDTIPYGPNQSLIVVKTYNSWHSIRPMQAKGSPMMRRTMNINLCDRLLEI